MRFLSLILAILFIGCASKNIEKKDNFDDFSEFNQIEEVYDPFEGYNRAMTKFNDIVYSYVFYPISDTYHKVVPSGARKSVNNFFHNLMYPIRLINNLLQAKFKNSFDETNRFLINSTLGIFGLFDVASSWFGIKPHNEDFGQTLAYYGVKSGPYIVLPFLGPSNLRDMFSLYPDSYLNPLDYHNNRKFNLTKNYKQSLYLKAYEKINNNTFIDYNNLKKDSIDLYILLRDAYMQKRKEEIEK